MKALRIAWRGSALALSCGAFYATWLLGWPAAAACGRREPWRAWLLQRWARQTLRCLHVRVEVAGGVPRAPFLLVSNHLGYLDIVVLASVTPCVFVSKAEVARWPVIGLFARSMGTLFLERGRKRDVARVAGEIRRRLDLGQGVVVFPEGTSSSGAEVGPFRSSLLEPAAEGRLPVLHATLRYGTAEGDPPAHLAVSWWGDMEFGPHLLELLGLSRIEASVVFGEEAIRESDRKRLAAELRRRVAQRFTPMTEPGEACRTQGVGAGSRSACSSP